MPDYATLLDAAHRRLDDLTRSISRACHRRRAWRRCGSPRPKGWRTSRPSSVATLTRP